MTTRKIVAGARSAPAGRIAAQGKMFATQKPVAGHAGDTALAIVGCCLALGSATFGIGMALHGPLASFGKGGGFTVFAQLAPRGDAHVRAATTSSTDLDLTATASIPQRDTIQSTKAAAPSVTLETADTDVATIAIDGQSAVVHVGDDIPGMGEVLAIVPGPKPEIRTAHGLILAAAAAR